MEDDLENLLEKERLLLEIIEQIEGIIEDCMYWNIDTDNLDKSLVDLKNELEKNTEKRIEKENRSNY